MQKRHSHQEILKNVQSFRARQRVTAASHDDSARQQQYEELRSILSPFWAWRSKSS